MSQIPDPPFANLPADSRSFYQRLFNRLMLNLWAVRSGLFDEYFCEAQDLSVFERWDRELPRITEHILLRRKI